MVAICVLVIVFIASWFWIGNEFIDKRVVCPGCGKRNFRRHLACAICDRRWMILESRRGRISLSCGHCHMDSDGLCECGRDLTPLFTQKARWWL
jgi:hypothetical protein